MLFLQIPGVKILVLNTLECVQDLMDKRYAVYSDRPTFPMVGEMMGLDAVSRSVMSIRVGIQNCRFSEHAVENVR